VPELYHVKYADLPGSPSVPLDRLSLFISASSVQFAAFSDAHTVEGIADCEPVRHFTGDISTAAVERILSDYQLQGGAYRNVNVAILNREFTLLPEAFDRDDTSAELLSFSSGINVISCSREHVGGVAFCYSVDRELVALCERTFPGASIRHAGIVTLALAQSTDAEVFVSIHRDFLEVCCRSGRQLQLYNVFHFETNEDALYFVLFTLEQLGHNPEHVHMSVAAELPVTNDLIVLIRKYIRNVHMAVRHRDLVMKRGSDLPAHFFHSLLQHHLCGL
jgi:hypothetical protein